jgi:tRNA modification GTPase
MTIFALSTGSSKSGIAVIRISGKDTEIILSKITSKNFFKPRRATLCEIRDPDSNEIIDKGLILLFPRPNSYTGEDLAELHVHGSKAIISAILSTLSKFDNCRLAEPGEFTKLAYENGKLNLLDVEALSD